MDYTKFLGKKEHVVLAYLGGAHVFGKDRRLRVEGPRPAPGFHRFELTGRNARALEAVEPPDLADLPKARGHLVTGWLVSSAGLARLSLLPEDEPPPLATTRARRWHSGDLLFEALDFDGEVEEEARLRLERHAPLADLKGVASTLRAAYGIALALSVSRRAGTPLAVREVAGQATRLADLGEAAVHALLADLERERLAAQQRAWARALEAGRPQVMLRGPGGRRGRVVAPTLANADDRAEAALDGADARMLAARRLEGGNLEVAFEFMGERFVSVVDALSLQVIDSGEDQLVTLDSLPGVIREAIDTDRLVITRR
ncbi:MAG TPA: hypothetical protein VLT33_30065 [Labilithrix sp.]|nr:hypothetical protein [Labilithrix sp.]